MEKYEIETTCLKLPVKLAFKRVKKDDRLLYKAIGWWTKSTIYHVEIIIDKYWISADPKGTYMKEVDSITEEWDILDIRDVIITKEQFEYIINWIKANTNIKYDWLAILYSQVLPLGIDNPNRWICSELCTRILQMMSYSEVQHVRPQNIAPCELAALFNYK